MNQRDETQGNEHVERGREGNGGRDFYPGSHGFDEAHDRSYNQGAAGRDAERWNERSRHEQRDAGRGRGWDAGRGASWDADRGYRGGAGPYGPPPAYWNDRPSWQDQYGLGQHTHWRDPNQYRPEQPGRTRYREGNSAGHFPRDQYGHEHSSDQLFGRQPFGPPEDTHYYGTGSAGWGGPGFTGGAYAYGNGPRDQGRQIEEEYSDESAVSYEQGPRHQVGQRYDQRYGRQYGQGQPQPYGQSYGQPYGYGRNPGYPTTRRHGTGPKGYQRSDERLKEDISERLMESHYIDSSDVSVEVRGAKVVLEGSVPSRHMKHAIEDLVDACPGVQDIDNRVRVANQGLTTGTGGSSSGIGTGSGAGMTSSASGSGALSGTNTPNGTKRSS